jgi:hypothetical protein
MNTWKMIKTLTARPYKSFRCVETGEIVYIFASDNTLRWEDGILFGITVESLKWNWEEVL